MITISGCQLLPDDAQLKSFRVLVQQGNVIEESKVDSLKINMTKEQVIFLMGEPVVNNIFDKERWDYVYYKKRDPETTQLNIVSIFFKNNSVASMKKIIKNDDGLFEVSASNRDNIPEFVNDDEAIALKNEVFDKIKLEGTKEINIKLNKDSENENESESESDDTSIKENIEKPVATSKEKNNNEMNSANKEELVVNIYEKRKNDNDIINEIIMGWANSWQNKKLDEYFSYYESDFTTSYFEDSKMWKEDRAKRISSKSEIIITIKDLSIKFTIEDVEKAVATFSQEYTSDNYSDKVIKKITLVKNNNNWLIKSEELLDGKY
jgi:outer membrane protein assembly factor BamE